MSKRLWTSVALVLGASIPLACSEAAPDDSGAAQNTGAASGSGSAPGVGGTVASGSASGVGGNTGVGGVGTGAASSVGGTGGLGSGGLGSGGLGTGGLGSGGLGSGGLGTGGGTGGSASGGASAGGTGGTASGGTGGSSHQAVPSVGCGKSGRPENGSASGQNYNVTFPESYDGSKPLPMLLGLHANGNPITQIQNLTNNSPLATEYVRVFPKSAGSGWVYNTDISRINTAFDDVLDKYCVDTSRVFLTGHSSGAQMGVQMLCSGDDRFAGIAPVAASKYCNSLDPIPAMYIQGIADAQRGGSNGKDVVDVFAAGNSCDSATMPFPEVMGCTSSFNQKQVAPGCVEYQGCDQPLIWCSHNDEGYNNTDGRYHGWPCFASKAMADFFSSLP
jgi:poly(3-hydroxybutyrate) depolymerase